MGEGQSELVAVEGAGGFTDHDGVEGSTGSADVFKKAGTLGPSTPWLGSGHPNVEVLLDDDSTAGVDQSGGAIELPRSR